MKKELNYFQKFIYLAAVQLILVSQLLVIAGSITTPVYAESGSGSDGQTVETVSDNSGSGSSSEEVSSDSGTSGGDVSPTDESAGAVEQADGSNSGSGSSGSNESSSGSGSSNEEQPAQEEQTDVLPVDEAAPVDQVDNSGSGNTDQQAQPTDNSGSGNADQQAQADEEPVGEEAVVADEEATPADVVAGEEASVDQVDNSGPGNTNQEEPAAGGVAVEIDQEGTNAPGDTINVAPGGTAPEGTPTTILEQTTVPAAGEIDPAIGFPTSYQDATGVAVVPCLDGTDPNCVLPEAGEEPGFDPSQPTELGTNFPSEFFYWIAESDSLDTPNGGKTFIRTALEGAFLNEEPLDGDQMVFGRIRVTGTGLEPNSEYTVTHPYGVDTYATNDVGVITRGEGTEDIGCEVAPCDFTGALDSSVFENFLRWDSDAPVGTLGDAVTPHTVTGSPTGDNFFRIEGPGLPLEGLFTNLFTVAGKLLSGEFLPGAPSTDGETVAEIPTVPGSANVGEVNLESGFPVSYQDALGVSVAPCLDGTDTNCVLPEAGEEPGFDPSQPTELGTNFPSEFFYWIAESDSLDTPNGGKTFIRTALEGAFLNEEPAAGDQMVFGRLRLTGTGLEPNSVYTVTHPYGLDTYMTDERGIVRRGEGTEDIGCFSAPCDFAAALQSRVFEGFLQMESGAPVGYLGDAVTMDRVIGSPVGQNFFRIEGPGLPEGGLFTDLFTVAGKLAVGLGDLVGDLVGGNTPAEEPATTPDGAGTPDEEVVTPEEPVVDTDLPADEIAEDLLTEDLGTEVPPVEGGDDDVVTGDPEITIDTLPDGNVTLTTEDLASSENGSNSSSGNGSPTSESSTSNDSGQSGGSQTQAAASGSSDDNSSGSSEEEQRGSVAEGELPGVDEEQALGAFAEMPALVLGQEVASEPEQNAAAAIAQEEEQQESSNTLEILLALAALAIAGGLMTGSALGNLNLQRILHIKKG